MKLSAALVAWASHLRGCDDCAQYRKVSVGDAWLIHAEAAPRIEHCAVGRKLQDAWLDEPEPPRRGAA